MNNEQKRELCLIHESSQPVYPRLYSNGVKCTCPKDKK